MAGLYLHIPFCTQRCVYCDFYFVTTQKNHAPFVQAMRTEIEAYGREYGGLERVDTIYLGGGTPSLLSLDDLARVLEPIYQHFDCVEVQEITIEVNPENVTRAYLSGLRGLGITRLSLGIQSFFDEDLRFMGRAHDAGQAQAALDISLAAGFDSISVDLIFGVPEQAEEHWMANLERVTNAGVPHLSTYGLTVEERTPLWKQVQLGKVVPAEDEVMRDRFLRTIGYLSEAGYEHYEISSFAREGARSRHNQQYWNHSNYLGFGPSAHSLWWRSGSSAVRWANVRNLRQYVALLEQRQRPIDQQERLSLDDLAEEFVMLRLRLLEDGLDLDTLETRYGVDLLVEQVDELAALERSGLARLRNGVVRLTPEGAVLADSVTARLLPGPSSIR